jgi:hypothetical protein
MANSSPFDSEELLSQPGRHDLQKKFNRKWPPPGRSHCLSGDVSHLWKGSGSFLYCQFFLSHDLRLKFKAGPDGKAQRVHGEMRVNER